MIEWAESHRHIQRKDMGRRKVTNLPDKERWRNDGSTERLKHLELWAQHNLHKLVSCFREHNEIMHMKFNKYGEYVPLRHTETLVFLRRKESNEALRQHHQMRTLRLQWNKLSSYLRTHRTHFLHLLSYHVYCFAESISVLQKVTWLKSLPCLWRRF